MVGRLGGDETGVITWSKHVPCSLLGGGPSGIGMSSSLSTGSSMPGGGPSGITISSSESGVKSEMSRRNESQESGHA